MENIKEMECCGNPSQCWEECGELGKSEGYVATIDEVPVIHVMYECESNGIIGSTHAVVKRIEREDDGAFTVVIDGYPR